jgi:hypothetical protein
VTFGQGYSPARPVTRIAAVDGRTVDYIYLPERRRVHSIEFPHFFKDFDVRAYQVRQHAAGSVTIGIAVGPSFSGLDRERVERILRQNLEGVHVQFEYGLELARTNEHAKLRPVISECSPDAFTINTNVMSAPV